MRTVKKLPFLFYLIIILSLFLVNCENQDKDVNSLKTLSIDKGWQYRTGDSPVDKNGDLVWLNESMNSLQWKDANKIEDIPTQDYKSIWIRITLPDTTILNPVLHIDGIRDIAQIYLNEQLIYQSGNFSDINAKQSESLHQRFINLPEITANGRLVFRIWSDQPSIGFVLPLWIASENSVLRHLFITNIENFFFMPVFIFLAILLIIKVLFFKPDNLLLGISVYLLGMGIFLGSTSEFFQIIFHKPRLYVALNFISLLLFTNGGLLLIKEIVSDEYKNIARWIVRIYFGFLLLSLIPVALFIPNIISLLYTIFFSMFFFATIVIYYILIKSIQKGKKNTKLFSIGFTFTAIAAVFEVLVHFTAHGPVQINLNLFSFHINFLQYGALGFVITLAWIVNNTYNDAHHQKEVAQKQAMESEKYKELDQLKSRFFANISHEFRTPLTLILGTAKQIQKSSKDREIKSKSDLQIKNGNRLLNLVNELLDLSKIDAGGMEMNLKCQDIIPQIKELCHHFESYAESKNIQIDLNLDINEAVVCYDYKMIEKVLFNLFSNAVKFSPDGGIVYILVKQNEYLEIHVKDNGVGISQEHLPHIFDRFYQSEKGYSQDYQGTGIGLALAHELINLHHGKIGVDSEPGKGSTFTVYLKMGIDHFSKAELLTTSVNGHRVSENKFRPKELSSDMIIAKVKPKEKDTPIILVAEDNSDLRNYIREELSINYYVLEAENGKNGFDIATEQIPDLIISDVMMPEMNGYQLCEKLKTDERTSHIPVILLTARSDHDSKIEGLTLGADDYLTKPFESEELKIRIHNLIEQRRKLREKFSQQQNTSIKEIAVVPTDEQFLERMINIITENIGNSELNVDWLSERMGLSRSQLHRKLKALTNLSPGDFIRSYRLKIAKELLETTDATISDIAYKMGFSSPDYFSRCFKKQYGDSPSKYIVKK